MAQSTDGRRGGGRKPRPIREIPFSAIEGESGFILERIPGAPAPVGRTTRGTYYIRVTTSMAVKGTEVTSEFDYFRMEADGTVTSAPRGYAKDYKPGRITGMDEAVAKYAWPS